MQAVAAGLACLHEQNILHRDMKTPNLLLTAEGRVKIADLGLGKMLSGQESLATQQGTHIWTSPEILLKGSFSLASDIWSYSTILWEVSHSRTLLLHLFPSDPKI